MRSMSLRGLRSLGKIGGGSKSYAEKVKSSGPIAYWTQGDTSGVTAVDEMGLGNGTYRNNAGVLVGVTLGQTGIGDGKTAALYNGTSGYCNVYSAALAGAFSGNEGSLMAWYKPAAAATWTDGATRRFIRLAVDANNYATLYKSATNNTLGWVFSATSGTSLRTVAGQSFTTWAQLVVTWSKTAGRVRAYLNASQQGADMANVINFVGTLAETTCVIGAETMAPANITSGSLAHIAVWTRELTAAEILGLYPNP